MAGLATKTKENNVVQVSIYYNTFASSSNFLNYSRIFEKFVQDFFNTDEFKSEKDKICFKITTSSDKFKSNPHVLFVKFAAFFIFKFPLSRDIPLL